MNLHSYLMRDQVRNKGEELSESLFAAFVQKLSSGSTVYIPTATEGRIS